MPTPTSILPTEIDWENDREVERIKMIANTIARTMGTTRFIDIGFTGFSYWISATKVENKNNNANEKQTIFLLCK